MSRPRKFKGGGGGSSREKSALGFREFGGAKEKCSCFKLTVGVVAAEAYDAEGQRASIYEEISLLLPDAAAEAQSSRVRPEDRGEAALRSYPMISVGERGLEGTCVQLESRFPGPPPVAAEPAGAIQFPMAQRKHSLVQSQT